MISIEGGLINEKREKLKGFFTACKKLFLITTTVSVKTFTVSSL